MAGKCEICGKGPQFGHNVSHSRRRTNRSWRPNLQKVVVSTGDKPRRMTVCTRCLRDMQKT